MNRMVMSIGNRVRRNKKKDMASGEIKRDTEVIASKDVSRVYRELS